MSCACAGAQADPGISILPNELLAAIFEATQQAYWYSPPEKLPSLPPEILLSRVDRRFRDVAVCTPTLWSTIHVSPDMRSLKGVAAYVERSKACHLHLQLDFTHPSIDTRAICELLIPHAERWSILDVTSDRPYVVRAIVRYLRHLSVPHLRAVSLALDEKMALIEDFDDECAQVFTGGAPRLSDVRMECIGLGSCWPPMKNVSTLYLHTLKDTPGVRYEQIRDMLLSSTSLTHLSLDEEIVDAWPFDLNSLELPHLRSLRVRSVDHNCPISDLLLAISAVNLESLWLENVVDRDFCRLRSSHALSTALDFPKLRLLAFDGAQLSVSAYHIFARYLPAISDLYVSYPSDPEFVETAGGIWDLLCDHYLGMRNPPWPQIETLAIRGLPRKPDWFYIVHARIAMGFPLIRLRLDSIAMASLKLASSYDSQLSPSWLKEAVELEEFSSTNIQSI